MEFVIYSKENCPYCEKVKQLLNVLNIDHTIYNLNEDFSREIFYSKFGENSTFPQVIVNETVIGGSTEFIKYLRENQLS